MRNLAFFIAGMLIVFGMYEFAQNNTEEEDYQDIENSEESLEFESQNNNLKVKPNIAPNIFTKEFCDHSRVKCEQIMQIANSTPDNVTQDADFKKSVARCEYMSQECEKRNL